VAAGVGVYLGQGGVLTNQASGFISAYRTAVSIRGAAGTITNYGIIQMTGTGTAGSSIYLGAGGSVTNFGLISGPAPATGSTGYPGAISARNQPVTVRNFGTITKPERQQRRQSQRRRQPSSRFDEHNFGDDRAPTAQSTSAGPWVSRPPARSDRRQLRHNSEYNEEQRRGRIRAGGTAINHGLIQSAHRRRVHNTAARSTISARSSARAALRTRGAGVYLGAGGLITNAAGASINAVRGAVSLRFFGTTSARQRWSTRAPSWRRPEVSIARRHRQQHDRQFRRDYRYQRHPPFASAPDDLIVLESGSSLQGVITGFHPATVRPAVPDVQAPSARSPSTRRPMCCRSSRTQAPTRSTSTPARVSPATPSTVARCGRWYVDHRNRASATQ